MEDNTYNHNKILDKNRYRIQKSNNNQGQERKNQGQSDSRNKSLSNSKGNSLTDFRQSDTNKTINTTADSMNKTAIALSYNQNDDAPKIIAS